MLRFPRTSKTVLVGTALFLVVFFVFVYRDIVLERRCLSAKNLDYSLDEQDDAIDITGAEEEQRHIVYIRIPKTGSSTVTMLVWRYAWTRMLNVISVKPGHDGSRKTLDSEHFYVPLRGKKYDCMAEHVLFERSQYDIYFPEDTVYFTMLRNPLSMLESTLYYVVPFPDRLPGRNKVAAYLENPALYDNIAMMADRSYTRNPQMGYFRFNKKYFDNSDLIRKAINEIDSALPLVMILEKIDESLILLKKLLKWPMKDLIYVVQNINKNKAKFVITDKEKEKYREWSKADHMLYEFFLDKLEKKVTAGGEKFKKELSLFKKYKQDVTFYCQFQLITVEKLDFPKTDYNEAFSVRPRDCILINMDPQTLLSNIRKRQFLNPYMSSSLLDKGFARHDAQIVDAKIVDAKIETFPKKI